MKSQSKKKLCVVIAIGLLAVSVVVTYALVSSWYMFTDFARMTVKATLHVGSHPRRLALSPEGEKLYIVDHPPDGQKARVIVLDTRSRSVQAEISLGSGFPYELAVSPDGRCALVAISRAGGSVSSAQRSRVEAFDTATGKKLFVTALPPGGSNGPCAIALTPDGRRAFVVDRDVRKVFSIDATTGALIQTSRGVSEVWGAAISPDGRWCYVPSFNGKKVMLVDTRTGAVTGSVPVDVASRRSPAYVSLTPDGRRAYVTFWLAEPARIAVIDTDSTSPSFHQQIDVVETPGSELRRVTFNPAGTLALVVSGGTDELLLLDTRPGSPSYHTVIRRIAVGDEPVDVVTQTHEDGSQTVYVANWKGGTVSVLRK